MSETLSRVLKKSYEHYVKAMVEKDGRPLADPDKDDLDKDGNRTEKVTFSEAISYMLPRAVLMNDRKTFDRVWLWASKNMQRRNIPQIFDPKTKEWQPNLSKKDNLFAWRYVPTVDGKTGGVLVPNDIDPATDADQDIAAALLLADKKWGSTGKVNYKAEALAILIDIWNKETQVINGVRVLIAGDSQIYAENPITGKKASGINISYFRPTYYETLFAEADPEHDWKSMVAPCYEVIRKAERAIMHDEAKKPVQGSVNLVPDWVTMDAEGNIGDHGWVPNDYYAGGDAFRTPFWIALQHKLNPSDTMAASYCDCTKGGAEFSPCLFLQGQLQKNGTIYSGYNIDGTVHWPNEELYALGADMAYFSASGNIPSSNKLYLKLESAYHVQGYWGNDPNNYYSQNWIWFGLYFLNEMGGPKRPAGFSRTEITVQPMRSEGTEQPTRTEGVRDTAPGKISYKLVSVEKAGSLGGDGSPQVRVSVKIEGIPSGATEMNGFIRTNQDWPAGNADVEGKKSGVFEFYVYLNSANPNSPFYIRIADENGKKIGRVPPSEPDMIMIPFPKK